MGEKYKNSGQVGAMGEGALSHDNTFNQTNNYYQPASFVPPALHQLPPAPRDLTGRETKLQELEKMILEEGLSILGIHGLGGIGKTALALALAERLTPNYPDGQIYLNLQGVSPVPLSTEDIMRYVLSSYNVEIPSDSSNDKVSSDSIKKIEGSYYSLLQNKGTLLLLDNVAEFAQIAPLLPPNNCILLFTSRMHLVFPGSYSDPLETLSPPSAREFLLKIAPRLGNQAGEIAKQCGYLPLALRLAANTIAKGTLTPEDYLEQLTEKQGQGRIELIDASISLSYNLLTDKDKRLWRLLAKFPATFALSNAASLWNLEKKPTQDKLDHFYSSSLIEWNETDRQYQLHDLVRVYANDKLTDEERNTEEEKPIYILNESYALEGSSRGIIQCIAALAGVNLRMEQGYRTADYGIDATFHPIKYLGNSLVESGFPLDAQVKATANWKAKKENIIIKLDSKSYNRIITRNNEPKSTPLFLIVVCFPYDRSKWLTYTEEELILGAKCYWVLLKGQSIKNQNSLTLYIPRTQLFTPESLNALLDRVESGYYS